MTTSDGITHARSIDLPRLTSLRAFAALAVFAFHIFRWTEWNDAQLVAGHGYAGVTFFFILSGFLLTWSFRGEPLKAFYFRRFARIYPAYLVMIIVAYIVPVRAAEASAAGAGMSIAMLQAWAPFGAITFGANGVGWSLSCEAFFYALLPLVLPIIKGWKTSKVLLAAAAFWSVLTIAAVVLLIMGDRMQLVAFANPLIHSGEFFIGIAAAIAMQRGWRPRISLAVASVLTVSAYVALMWWNVTTGGMGLVMALPFLAVIVTAAHSDLQERRGWLPSAPLIYAGQVSYAFYLVHELVILNLPARLPQWQFALLALAVSAIVAAVLHHGVELPAQRGLRRFAPKAAPRHAKVSTGPSGN